MTPAELEGSRLWRYGPEWLVHLQSHADEDFEMPDECLRNYDWSPLHSQPVDDERQKLTQQCNTL